MIFTYRNRILSFSLVVSIFFCACSFNYQNPTNSIVTDISDQLSFRMISHQGFMGGSVLFNPDSPGTGQLQEGAIIALRLGYLEKGTSINDDCGFSPVYDKTNYGYLKVVTVDTDQISFFVTLYSNDGELIGSDNYSIKLGNSIDLNNDGCFDLSYSIPEIKRPNMEDAVYLNFICSKETSTTSMFAVLPEQYSGNTYPDGLIGINPNGRFIISKYKVNSSERSIVSGVVNGDYVLDNSTGEYELVVSNRQFSSARAIDESELMTNTETAQEDFYYKESDFSGSNAPSVLFSLLPLEIHSKYSSENINDYIEALNFILEQQDLIKIMLISNNEEIDSEVKQLLDSISSLSLHDLVALNRLFIDDRFPGMCLAKADESLDITQVIPYYSCIIGNLIENTQGEENNFSRSISSYPDYLTKQNQINDVFSDFAHFTVLKNTKFTDVFTAALEGKTGPVDVLSNINLQLGVRGHLDNNDGDIQAQIGTALYIKSEALLSLSKSYTYHLLPDGQPITLYGDEIPIQAGPITLFVSLPVDFDIPITVGGSATFSTNMVSVFTGLYGGTVSCGAQYGARMVRWFKIWKKWVYRPEVYFSPYAYADGINLTAAYYGPQDKALDKNTCLINGTSLSISISPTLSVGPQLRWSFLAVKLQGVAGFESRADISSVQSETLDTMDYKGVGTLSGFFGATCTPNATISLPFGLGSKSFGFTINIGNRVRKEICRWDLF